VGLVPEPGQLVERVDVLAVPVRARVSHRSPFSRLSSAGRAVSRQETRDVVMTGP
jgi:hypothetical protein